MPRGRTGETAASRVGFKPQNVGDEAEQSRRTSPPSAASYTPLHPALQSTPCKAEADPIMASHLAADLQISTENPQKAAYEYARPMPTQTVLRLRLAVYRNTCSPCSLFAPPNTGGHLESIGTPTPPTHGSQAQPCRCPVSSNTSFKKEAALPTGTRVALHPYAEDHSRALWPHAVLGSNSTKANRASGAIRTATRQTSSRPTMTPTGSPPGLHPSASGSGTWT